MSPWGKWHLEIKKKKTKNKTVSIMYQRFRTGGVSPISKKKYIWYRMTEY